METTVASSTRRFCSTPGTFGGWVLLWETKPRHYHCALATVLVSTTSRPFSSSHNPCPLPNRKKNKKQASAKDAKGGEDWMKEDGAADLEEPKEFEPSSAWEDDSTAPKASSPCAQGTVPVTKKVLPDPPPAPEYIAAAQSVEEMGRQSGRLLDAHQAQQQTKGFIAMKPQRERLPAHKMQEQVVAMIRCVHLPLSPLSLSLSLSPPPPPLLSHTPAQHYLNVSLPSSHSYICATLCESTRPHLLPADVTLTGLCRLFLSGDRS